MNKDKTPKLVKFAGGGDIVYFSSHTCSGYGSPEKPHAASGIDIPDGTPVLDIRKAIETDAGFKWVFAGPMVNVSLEADEIKKCPQPNELFAEAVAENLFGQLLQLHKEISAKAGPLDSVSIPVYLAGWLNLGARVGYYKNNEIIWKN